MNIIVRVVHIIITSVEIMCIIGSRSVIIKCLQKLKYDSSLKLSYHMCRKTQKWRNGGNE